MDGERFNLLCVYDAAAIMRAWPVISGGLEIMLENSGSDTSLDKIYNDIMAGRLLLWVGMLDGEYAGFVTTQIVDLPPTKKHLWIVHAYKMVATPTMWLLQAYQRLEEFAKVRGCDSIRFYGLAKPWQNKFLALGFHLGYQEFVKELKNENLRKSGNRG